MTNPSSHSPGKQPVEILMAEDNPGDAELALEALTEAGVIANLTVVQDGIEALDFLRKNGKYQNVARPDLIFLDLEMPKMNGLEVLAEIKKDPNLQAIPVIVLTTSDNPRQLMDSYNLQASCYIIKPADLEDFDRITEILRDFCLTVVKLPPVD